MLTVVSDGALIHLHQSRTLAELAHSLFELINEALPNRMQVLVIRPYGAELQTFCSIPELLPVYEKYIVSTADESWLNCGIPASEKVERSKEPSKPTKQTRFYKEFMRPFSTEHAFSVVAWNQNAWRACLTVLRTSEQEDFTEREREILATCRSHFQAALDRIAAPDDSLHCLTTLERFIWSLPTAAIVLDWNLKPLYFNASALELGGCWKSGLRFAKMKRTRALTIPSDIVAAIEKQKALIPSLKASSSHWHGVVALFDMSHPTLPELKAKISFCPGDTPYLNDGTFLLSLKSQNRAVDERKTYEGFSDLSPRERDVVLLAAKGLKSGEISKALGTAGITVRSQLHSAYKKLGISSRYELVLMFSHHPLMVEDAVRSN